MDYKSGDIVMKCKPFVHSLNWKQKSIRCDFCFTSNASSLSKCSICKSMYYCDKKCQKLDWNECHRSECKLYLNYYNNYLNRDCDRFVLRLWLKTQSNAGKQRSVTETHESLNGLNRSLAHLMTHSQQIRVDSKRMQFFNDICNRFQSCRLDIDYENLFLLFCKICINSFSILNEDLNQIGSGLYILGSVLNHSCCPNAAIIFNGIDLEVRALKPIRSDEEVLINYIDLKMNRTDRRSRLSEQYYFDCNCLKCWTLSDINIDYDLVKRLDQEFDDLIDNQKDWLKCYSIGVQSIPLYHQIYGDFHPDLTVQYMRVLKVKILITESWERNDSSEERNVIQLIQQTRKSIETTHGFDHKLFEVFKQTLGI